MDVKALQSPRCSIGPRKPSCTCLAEAGQAYYIPRLQSDQSCSLFETHTRLPEALAREQELGYAMQQPQQQDVQVRGARGPCGEYGAIGVVELKQDAKQVFEFMRRIEEQPRWNPGVKLSQIVNKVANTTHVKQVLNWSFLALRGDFNMNLAMHEEPQQLRIRTELLQGSMMRRFSSSVGVTRIGPGACRLTMDLYMQPTVPVPFGIRHMVGHQVRRQLHGVMEKIKSTVENEQPRRRSFAERCCDMSALQSALQSHPLDISVWG